MNLEIPVHLPMRGGARVHVYDRLPGGRLGGLRWEQDWPNQITDQGLAALKYNALGDLVSKLHVCGGPDTTPAATDRFSEHEGDDANWRIQGPKSTHEDDLIWYAVTTPCGSDYFRHHDVRGITERSGGVSHDFLHDDPDYAWWEGRRTRFCDGGNDDDFPLAAGNYNTLNTATPISHYDNRRGPMTQWALGISEFVMHQWVCEWEDEEGTHSQTYRWWEWVYADPQKAALFALGRFLDANGDPVSLDLTGAVLQLEYWWRLYPPMQTTQHSIDGHTVTVTPVNVDSAGAWRSALTDFGPDRLHSRVIAQNTNTVPDREGSHLVGSGIEEADSDGGHTEVLSVSDGAHHQSVRYRFDVEKANWPEGIGRLLVLNRHAWGQPTSGRSLYALCFDPPIQKSDLERLWITLKYSWGRY